MAGRIVEGVTDVIPPLFSAVDKAVFMEVDGVVVGTVGAACDK